MKSAILFGGQAFNFSESKPLNIEACELTHRLSRGFALSVGKIDSLNFDSSNEMQVIVLLYNYLRWRDEFQWPPGVTLVAGQSVAQILALNYSGLLSDDCLVDVLVKRTVALNKYVDANTGMISIVGFKEEDLEMLAEISSEYDGFISNYNAKNSITISGENEKLKKIQMKVSDLRLGLCQTLNVAGGWHSPCVQVPTNFSFMNMLRKSDNANRNIAVLDNTTLAKLTKDEPLETINELILRGMYSPVRWYETVSSIDNDIEINTVYFGGGFSMIEKLSKHSIVKTKMISV